jgi:hypothetical protein
MASGFLVFCIMLLLTSCRKKYLDVDFPRCLDKLIAEYDDGNCSNKLYTYDYRGEEIYYVTSSCRDACNLLYDESCDYMCSPFACGFAGDRDKDCAEFYSQLENEQLLWEED